MICAPWPADRNHHRVVLDVPKLASVLESLQHRLPGIETLHALQRAHKKLEKTKKEMD